MDIGDLIGVIVGAVLVWLGMAVGAWIARS